MCGVVFLSFENRPSPTPHKIQTNDQKRQSFDRWRWSVCRIGITFARKGLGMMSTSQMDHPRWSKGKVDHKYRMGHCRTPAQCSYSTAFLVLQRQNCDTPKRINCVTAQGLVRGQSTAVQHRTLCEVYVEYTAVLRGPSTAFLALENTTAAPREK